jgi:hypothetical protein
MKGMIFAGCSHTFGHGLWYYSGLDNIPYGDKHGIYHMNKNSYMKYTEANRYARLVVNHFETYELVRGQTGGSEDVSLSFIESLFSGSEKSTIIGVGGSKKKFDYDEIGYLIFQTSFVGRNKLIIEHEGKQIELNNPYLYDTKEYGEFVNQLLKYNINSFEEFNELLKKYTLNKIIKSFKFYESKGIKCRLFSWTNDYVDLIKTDTYLLDKLISMAYDNKKYDCILDMIKDGNEKLLINKDFEYFGSNPPNDSHPSKHLHKIMANNIISFIEKENYVNS